MLRLTDVRINTSYLPKIPTLNGIHIINSKVKVEINYVAIIIMFMVIREDTLNALHVRKYIFLSREESLATCQRKSPFEGFFS